MLRTLRSNLVIILVALLYLVTLALAMVLIDKGIYQQRKRAMLFEDRGASLNIRSRPIAEAAMRYIAGGRRAEDAQVLAETLREQIARANGVYLIRVSGAGGEVLAEVEDLSQLEACNTWRNNLFFRDFVSEGYSPLPGGEIVISYTTPAGIPAIEALTHRFRLIALLVAAAITVVFVTALRMVVLPIGRVLRQVQERGAELLPRPHGGLERAYNAVAAEALAARLAQRVTELIQSPAHWSQPEFDRPLVEAVRALYGLRAAALIAAEPPPGGAAVRALSAAAGAEGLEEEIRAMRWTWEDLAPDAPPRPRLREGERQGCLVVLAPVLDEPSRRLGVIVAAEGDWSHLPRWLAEVVRRIAAEMRRGLTQMPVFRDALLRQRSAANISLARSLGHDLTNIIATSKLDILSIQRWLERHTPRAPGAASDALLGESVQGLLNTTRFMQEIVNIYRAFSFMDEPRWERVDLNALVAHLADLFRLTLGQRVEVALDLAPDLGEVTCEPRLIQLALFNVLTNANQAIRRLGSDAPGTIAVSTRPLDAAAVEIAVRDTGPGIRDGAGALLEGERLYEIFYLGATTRREGDDRAEGLGLNWVWAIVTDFHGGRVEPRNLPGGGAEFRLTLPREGRPGAALATTKETPHDRETDAGPDRGRQPDLPRRLPAQPAAERL